MLKKILLAGFAGMLVSATAAYADTVKDTSSGVAYSLSYNTTGTADVYEVFLTINTTGYDGPSKVYPDFLNDVALQLAAQDSDYSMTVISAPTGYAAAVVDGGLSAGGCNASGSGFYCLEYTGAGMGLATAGAGDVYTFVFDVTDTNGLGGKGGLFTNGKTNVEAAYQFFNTKTDTMGDQKDNDTITLSEAPEPASIALLGTALIGMALLARKFGMAS